jgi:ribosomal protein S6
MMGFSIAICGLPNVGKTTLFCALTRKQAKISPVPFTTISPNVAKVEIDDERLKKLAEFVKPEKVTPAFIEFWDIAGLVKDAYKGEGLGNQFLAQIRHCLAVLMVARAFEDENVENFLGEINPEKEFEILTTEFLMKDLETVENSLLKTKEKKKKEILEKIKDFLQKGKKVSEIPLKESEKEEIKDYNFLTQKPQIYIVNTNSKKREFPYLRKDVIFINLKEELEAFELSEKEREEIGFKSKLPEIIKKAYEVLDLITFFTIAGGKEVRATTLKRGSNILEAAMKIHSDFAKHFVKAEVIFWDDLIKFKSLKEAKEKAKIKKTIKVYELAFLIPKESQIDPKNYYEKINALLQEKGGLLLEFYSPSLINLAYPIEKKESAYLASTVFQIKTEKIKEIEKEMKEEQKNKKILRFLLFKRE